MVDNSDMSIPNTPILVLHHTYFCDTLVSYPNFNFDKFQEFRDARMIYRFLSLSQAHLVEDLAYTTESAYNVFLKSFEKNQHMAEAWTVKKHLEGLVDIDTSPTLNALKEDGSIIVKADELLSLNAKRETAVVINSAARKAFVEKTIQFYNEKIKSKKFSEKDIPFRIYDYYKTNIFLSRYPEIYKEVLDRMKGEPF